ncbi:Ig-like domain-containing protein, partial [Listeria booriae]
MTKSKKQTIKKLAIGALVANTFISTTITSLPEISFAKETSTSNTNISKNLKSNLKASNIIENPNFKIDAEALTMPGWKFGIRDIPRLQTTGPLQKDLPLVKSGVLGTLWYAVDVPDSSNGTFMMREGVDNSLELSMQAAIEDNRYYIIYQNIKTVPGEQYVFNCSGLSQYIRLGINVFDSTETLISSTPLSEDFTVSGFKDGVINSSNTFTAQSNETRVEIVLGAGKFTAGGIRRMFLSGGVSVTPTDTTAPDAPNVTTVYDTDTTIKGTGEANCDVKVTLPSGEVVTGRTDGSGNFSITIPAQTAGREIKVTLTDGAGNESNPTTVIVQATALAKPTIAGVTTDDTTVTGTGITGATVTATIGSNTYQGTVVDGSYIISDIPKQPAGTVIYVKQSKDGKTSESASTTVTQGELAPPTINGVTTNDTQIYGTGISGATVTATIGSETYQGTVMYGSYIISDIPKQPAGTVIYVKQSKDGKTSGSVNTIVTQGTVYPPTINTVTTDDTTVKGTGVNGATVTVKIGSTEYTATVTGGEYSVTIPKQAVGTEITAKQALNGVTSMDATTRVIQGTVAAPTIDAVTTDDTTVKGTGINGATVTVKIGSDEYTATVANNAYSVTIPKQAVGTEITAKQALNGVTSM